MATYEKKNWFSHEKFPTQNIFYSITTGCYVTTSFVSVVEAVISRKRLNCLCDALVTLPAVVNFLSQAVITFHATMASQMINRSKLLFTSNPQRDCLYRIVSIVNLRVKKESEYIAGYSAAVNKQTTVIAW